MFSLEKSVTGFLRQCYREGAPLLIGVSGGPDSLALLHCLLANRQEFCLDLRVAHLDHGWRLESREEADWLEQHVQGLGLKFYRYRLADGCAGENQARIQRFAWFSQLYSQLECQALVLGHHADDQAETVLKRVLEGSSNLGGIQAVSFRANMEIWRPLLKHSKQEIIRWLVAKELIPIEDQTNLDPRFLRGRMRTEIIPSLQKSFGKGIAENLCRLGQQAQQFEQYLVRRIAPYFNKIERTKDVVSIDLTHFYPFEVVELRFFIKKFLDAEGYKISRQGIDSIIELLFHGNKQHLVSCKGGNIKISRRMIAIKNHGRY